MLGEGVAPDFANALQVVRVVHVEVGEEGGALLLRGGGQVDADVVRAGSAVDLAGASENARRRGEGAEEGGLVLCHRVQYLTK